MNILATIHFNALMGSFTILGQILIFTITLIMLFREKNAHTRHLHRMIAEWALEASFLIFLSGMVGSLLYSDVAQLTPCLLCWYQRIFLYPQVFILGMAAWKRDWNIIDYSILLSIAGVGVAAYHYALQMGTNLPAPCEALGSVPCNTTQILEFGYITIPLMSLTAFLLSLVLMIVAKREK